MRDGRGRRARRQQRKLRVVVHVWRCDHGHWSAVCACGRESPCEWDDQEAALHWAKGHVGGAHRGRSPELHVMRDELLPPE